MFSQLLNLTPFVFLCAILFSLSRKQISLSRLVLTGLVLGAGLGAAFQQFYSPTNAELHSSLTWISLIGDIYIRLLKMVIMPLVLVSILGAMVRMHNASSLGAITFSTLATLLTTTVIAALIAVSMTLVTGIDASSLTHGNIPVASLASYTDKFEALQPTQLIASFIPSNIFSDLTGARQTSIISVVIFAILTGFIIIKMAREKSPYAKSLISGICACQEVVMRMVRLIMRFTPYGVMALITKVVASTSLASLTSLGSFIITIYTAIALMFICHGVIVLLMGINPLTYFGKIWPILTLAFSSTSSAACLPLNIETQVKSLNVQPAIANFSASIGASAGMNGCAGIYPAMLATMVALSTGITIDPTWITTLCMIIVVSSFGLAGVGGGGSFAALMVLSALGLPLELIGILIAIEPIIDMGRTALNVSGAILSGVVTNKLLSGKTKKDEMKLATA